MTPARPGVTTDLITAHEFDHPHTPRDVQLRAAERIHTLVVASTPDEQRTKDEILTILTGDGRRERMQADAEHVFEAQKYGGFFITTDNRLLSKGNELKRRFGLQILPPSEFLAVVERAKARQQEKKGR